MWEVGRAQRGRVPIDDIKKNRINKITNKIDSKKYN